MKKILAIDDQMDNLISVKAVLQTYMPECKILLAQSGREGIDIALKEKPDVILLDIIMPQMDGFETCKRLKAELWTKSIPVVMVTAIKTDTESRVKGLELGADAFLSKPYDTAELTATINVMLRIKNAEDKLRTERDDLDKLVDIKTEQIKYQSTLLQNVMDAVVATDMDFFITSWNNAAEELYGWKAGEVIGKQIGDILKPEYLDHTRDEVIELVLKNKHYRGELIHYHKDGTAIRISGSASLIINNSGINIGCVTLYRDITAQVKAQQALSESEKKFRMLFQNLSTGFALHEIILDKKGNPVDYRFLEINPAFEQLTGLNSKDLIGKTCLEVLPTTEPFRIETYGKVALTGEPINFENYSAVLDRYYQVTAYSPESNKFATIFLDITERRILEKKLAKSKALLNASERSGKIGGWEFDVEKLTQEWTEETFRILEIDTTQGEPKVPEGIEFIDEPYREMAGTAINNAITNGEPYDQEWIITTAKGNKLWVHAVANINWVEGKISSVYGSFQDISERKNAEAEVQRIAQHYQALIEKAPDGIVLINAEGNFKYVSPSARIMFGYSLNEEIFGNPSEFTHHEDLQMVLAELAKIIEDPAYIPKVEYRFCDKKGNWKWVESTFSNLYADSSVEAIVINFRDITDRKHAESDTLESEKRFRALFESNSAAIAIIEPDTTISMVNEAYCRMSGYTREDVVGLSWTKQIPEKDLERLKEYNRLRLTEPEKAPVNYEFTFYKKNGETADALMSVGIAEGSKKIIASFADITDRLNAEKKLIESEKKLNEIISVSPIPMALNDDHQNIAFLNPAFTKTFGYTLDDIPTIDDWLRKAYPDEDYRNTIADEWRLRLEHSKLTGNEFYPMEVMINCKDGSKKTLVATANSFSELYKDNHLVVFYDITDRKIAEEELAKSHEMLFKLSEQVPGVIYLYRLHPDGRSYFPYSSSGMNDIYGYSPEDVRKDATPVFGRLHPDDLQNVSDLIYESARTLEVFYCEFRVVLPEKGMRWRYSHAVPERLEDGSTLWYGIIYDITDRKIAEEQIHSTNNFLDSIVENIPNMIFIKNAGDLKFTRINKAGEKLLGLSKNDLIGKSDYDFFSKETADFYSDADKEVLLSKQMKDIPEEIVETTDKGNRIVHTMKVPILDKNGEPEYLLGISEDITERKNIEAAIRQKTNELERFNNLMVGREIKMIELKKEINELLLRLGEDKKYVIVTDK